MHAWLRRDHRRNGYLILALALSMAWLSPHEPRTVFAADKPRSKTVSALIAAAQKELDAGNFARAGELFLEIWRQAPDEQGALYNAARAHQLAGRADKARELYIELLGLADLDPLIRGKAETQVRELKRAWAEAKAEAAARAEGGNHYALAADLWAEAVATLPDKLAWHLRWARALHLAGKRETAGVQYDALRQRAPDSPEAAQAAAWKAELTPAPAIQPGPSTVQSKVRPTSASRVPQLALTSGGVALAVGGGVVLALTAKADADLQATYVKTDAAGKITGIARTDALAEAARLESRYTMGWALCGVGVAGAAIGGWWLTRAPKAAVVVAPTADGFVVSSRF